MYICTYVHTCLYITYTETSLPLWRKYTHAVCERTDVLFLQEKQTRIPFLMRIGAKVFYNVGEDTRAYIHCVIKRILTYHPLCANRVGRARYAMLITLTFSFCKSFMDRIYLPCWIYVTFYRKTVETRVARWRLFRAASFPCGRDIFCARVACAKGYLYTSRGSHFVFDKMHLHLFHTNIFH